MTTDPKITEAIKNSFYRVRNWNARERSLMGVTTLAGIREFIAIELDEVRADLEPVEFVAPDFDAHYAAYFCASHLVPDYERPTEAQIATLARLSVNAGEMSTFSGRLTKKAAVDLINDYTN